MSKKQKRIFWPVVVIVALALGALAFASARNGRRTMEAPPLTSETPPGLTNATAEDYVRAFRLWPQLRWNLKALGNRLERPGKERLTLTGTLSRAGDAAPVPVLLILEFPDRLRLDIQERAPHHVITFNGKSAGKIGGPLDQSEEDLIETLVYDTAEHFFMGQMQRVATRGLGSRFRSDDGSFHDLYEVTDQVEVAPGGRTQRKLYYFNSDTQVLDRVRYQLTRNGMQTDVETRISDWQDLQGQRLPGRITRLENQRATATLAISSRALTPRLDDGIFGRQ
jgi:hypothetical protein